MAPRRRVSSTLAVSRQPSELIADSSVESVQVLRFVFELVELVVESADTEKHRVGDDFL